MKNKYGLPFFGSILSSARLTNLNTKSLVQETVYGLIRESTKVFTVTVAGCVVIHTYGHGLFTVPVPKLFTGLPVIVALQ